MKFILTTGWEDGIADLTARLVHELAQGKRVLWLVSGGSNIAASVQVMDSISTEYSQKLSIMPADERYGEPGHAESNIQKLQQAGFDIKAAVLLPVLVASQSFDEAAEYYEALTQHALDEHDVVIAQLGIGTDGHIAGILPDSPAAMELSRLVAHFDAPPLRRLTLTFPALERIDVAYAFAFGEPKLGALQTLQNETVDRTLQPSQILKQIPEAYIYNDQVGTA
jgi:6-phosphogluconolactonase